jgi:hypothetical protein
MGKWVIKICQFFIKLSVRKIICWVITDINKSCNREYKKIDMCIACWKMIFALMRIFYEIFS